MVSWNVPVRIGGRKTGEEAKLDLSDSSQQDNIQVPIKDATNTMVVRRNRISFDLERSTVHLHYRLDELSREEFNSLWVTPEEFQASKQEYVAIVRQMMKTIGEFPETEDCCPRGLGT